jgi:protein-tyrosine kinase
MSAVSNSNSASSILSAGDRLPLGELLCSLGKLSQLDIARIMVVQREKNLRFGEAAQGLGLVTREDVERALARQFDFPYADPAECELSPLLVTACEPFGPAAEAIRALRAQLSLRWFQDRHKALAVFSPRGSSGSSVVAANLAIAFAQLGERTLLIDANLRRPKLHTLFKVAAAEGLSRLLGGRCHLQEAVSSPAPFALLSVLTAGAAPPNPSELLSSLHFSYLIETAPAAFDVVIVDAPPILECPDAQIVASRTGGCLMVTRRHRTSIEDIELAKGQIEPTRAQIVGVVVND